VHQPPNVRLPPSHGELYGPRFVVTAFCWTASGALLVLTIGARAAAAVTDTTWFGPDPAWSEATGLLSDTLGTVAMGVLPVLILLALAFTVSLEAVHPRSLPPWTTREQLRKARVLAGNAVMGDDPRINLLARVHAGVHVRSAGWLLYRPALAGHLVIFGVMSGSGVPLLVRGLRDEDPALTAIGLHNVLLFAGFAVLALALAPRRRRMREFCALYDAAHRRVAR
jgi:hypothetical protein